MNDGAEFVGFKVCLIGRIYSAGREHLDAVDSDVVGQVKCRRDSGRFLVEVLDSIASMLETSSCLFAFATYYRLFLFLKNWRLRSCFFERKLLPVLHVSRCICERAIEQQQSRTE